MTVAELIAHLTEMPGNLEVILNFDVIGVLPLAKVKRMGVVKTVIQPGGYITIDESQATFECLLTGHCPRGWKLQRVRR